MQFLWKYIDDLMGKGLELSILLEMLFYVSASLIPLALPLAVLFSSIMTYGNLAENNELTALKSSGLSLFKVMRPMLVFVISLSILAFYFSNYVLPVANLKWRTIYYDILEKKPAFLIKEGIFYKDFENYHIKVDEKNKADGSLKGILIYDFTTGSQDRIIRAKEGQMIQSENEEYLFLQMKGGVIYEKVAKRKFQKVNVDFQKTFFTEAVIKFDMVGFDMEKSDEDLFKQDFEMMNFLQLGRATDSLQTRFDSLKISFNKEIKSKYIIFNDAFINAEDLTDSLNLLNENDEQPIDTIIKLENIAGSPLMSANLDAQNEIRNTKELIYHETMLQDHRDSSIVQYKTAWHKKFTLSFAILILFFIGAPLGAIIKKGGLGTPLVFATTFFLFYYILTITGENMVESNVVQPWLGLWLSGIALTPLGVFLTYKAANDSALFDLDVYKKWFSRIFNSKSKE